jgi:thymidine kinase
VLAIDEAQFFDDLVEFATQACDVDGKVVLVAGLSGDFKRAPFGRLLDLVPLATSVTLLKASCFTCGE